MDLSVIVGLISIGVGLVAYAIQNYYVRKNEIEKREYHFKRKQYEELIKKYVEGVHIVQTRKQSTSLDFKLEMDYATNLLYLYASGNVIRALKSLMDKQGDKGEQFRNLIAAMRNELNFKKGDLAVSEIELFAAT